MTEYAQPIGILGGTFDPIHLGHLRTAIELQQALNLAEVRLIPCYQPVHRKLPEATPRQRWEMVQIAASSDPLLKVDDCEIERKGPSYTIDTLEYLRSKRPRTPLCMIMGIDALLGFTSWHKWQDILTLSHLVIAHRPQYQLPQTGIVAELLKERLTKNKADLAQHLSGKILLHPVTAMDISSTDIRKQIASGKNVRFLLPDDVYEYLIQHRIYSVSRL